MANPALKQGVDATMIDNSPLVENNNDAKNSRHHIKGLSEVISRLAMVAALGSPFAAMANTAPSDALETPTATTAPASAPQAVNSFAETAPTIDAAGIKNILLSEPMTAVNVADNKGNKVNFSFTPSADGQYGILRIDPAQLPQEAGVTHQAILAVELDGNFYEMFYDTTLVAKFDKFGSNAGGAYDLTTKPITIALPLSKVGNGIQDFAGANVHVSWLNNNNVNEMLEAGRHEVVYTFEKTSSSAPAASNSVNMMPGAEVLSAPIKMSSIPALKNAKFPLRVSAYGGAIFEVNGDGKWVAAADVNADDVVVTKGKASSLSGVTESFGFMASDHKVKTEVQTLEYTTAKAETLSNDKNNPTIFVAVNLTLPTGATEVTITMGLKNGFISEEYKSGMVVQIEKDVPDKGTHCKLSYKLNGELVKKYFDVVPQSWIK